MADANAPVSIYLTEDSWEDKVAQLSSGALPGPSLPVPCLAEKPQRIYREIENNSKDKNTVIKLPDLARNIMPVTDISRRVKYSAINTRC